MVFDGSSHQRQSEQGYSQEDWDDALGGERAGKLQGGRSTMLMRWRHNQIDIVPVELN